MGSEMCIRDRRSAPRRRVESRPRRAARAACAAHRCPNMCTRTARGPPSPSAPGGEAPAAPARQPLAASSTLDGSSSRPPAAATMCVPYTRRGPDGLRASNQKQCPGASGAQPRPDQRGARSVTRTLAPGLRCTAAKVRICSAVEGTEPSPVAASKSRQIGPSCTCARGRARGRGRLRGDGLAVTGGNGQARGNGHARGRGRGRGRGRSRATPVRRARSGAPAP